MRAPPPPPPPPPLPPLPPPRSAPALGFRPHVVFVLTDDQDAEIGGMDRQTLRDWVHRFNGEGSEGMLDRRTDGPPPKLTAAQKAELSVLVEAGPDRKKDGALAPSRPEGGDRGSLRRGLSRAFGVAAAP